MIRLPRKGHAGDRARAEHCLSETDAAALGAASGREAAIARFGHGSALADDHRHRHELAELPQGVPHTAAALNGHHAWARKNLLFVCLHGSGRRIPASQVDLAYATDPLFAATCGGGGGGDDDR